MVNLFQQQLRLVLQYLANVDVLLVNQMCASAPGCRRNIWADVVWKMCQELRCWNQNHIVGTWRTVITSICRDERIQRNAHDLVPGQLLSTSQNRRHQHQDHQVVHEDLPPGFQQLRPVLMLVQRNQLRQGKHDDLWVLQGRLWRNKNWTFSNRLFNVSEYIYNTKVLY